MSRRASKQAPDRREADSPGEKTIAFQDRVLVERCRDGDMEAFGALVAKYQDRVFNLTYRMCGRRSDAEEFAQEAFLRALERIDQFRGDSRFYTWLFRIAANVVLSHRRRAARVSFRSLTGPAEYDGTQAEALTAAMADQRDPSPPAAAMSAEVARGVSEALESLDEEFRIVLVLRDMEDMDYAEIAEVLAVPVGTVKSRLHRARCLLKDRLTDLI